MDQKHSKRLTPSSQQLKSPLSADTLFLQSLKSLQQQKEHEQLGVSARASAAESLKLLRESKTISKDSKEQDKPTQQPTTSILNQEPSTPNPLKRKLCASVSGQTEDEDFEVEDDPASSDAEDGDDDLDVLEQELESVVSRLAHVELGLKGLVDFVNSRIGSPKQLPPSTNTFTRTTRESQWTSDESAMTRLFGAAHPITSPGSATTLATTSVPTTSTTSSSASANSVLNASSLIPPIMGSESKYTGSVPEK